MVVLEIKWRPRRYLIGIFIALINSLLKLHSGVEITIIVEMEIEHIVNIDF